MTIFISIAAYRDPELSATITDCINKADRPDGLSFGVCWQREAGEILPWAKDSRFHIIESDWRKSRGACWARSEIQKLWNGEEFFFQIDSHYRFAEHWDTKLLNLTTNAPAGKPIISTYCPPYTPGENNPLSHPPLGIEFYDFTTDGIPLTRPFPIPEDSLRGRLIRGRFLAAGFLFTLGLFTSEVRYDPELYFLGEEISLAVRAYTWGYETFHPTEVLGWHYYVRQGLPKHWHDHANLPEYGIRPQIQDEKSRIAVRKLLTEGAPGPFGYGPVHSVREYEAYAGVDFVQKKVQDYTRLNKQPPNPQREANWHECVKPWAIELNLGSSETIRSLLSHAERCYVKVSGLGDMRLYETVLEEDTIPRIKQNSYLPITVQLSFSSEALPHSWSVRFWSKHRGTYGSIGGKFTPFEPDRSTELAILQGYVIPV